MSEESQTLLEALRAGPDVSGDASIRYLGGNLREALAHYRVLFPELISYRGGHFAEDRFDKGTVNGMFDQFEFDAEGSAVAAAEQLINSVYLLAEDDESDFDLAAAEASAAAIAWVWRRWFRETYGLEMVVESSISGPDDCSIWFRTPNV